MPASGKVVRLHADARAELRASISFYRERAGDRWADQFKQRVEEGLRAIAATPERYSPAPDLPGVQKFRLRQFPFSLLYIDRPDHVWVVAVAHAGRKPGYWIERIESR